MRKRFAIWVVLGTSLAAIPAQGQRGNNPAQPPAASEEKPEEGIPVTDPLVIQQCGTCHTKDDKGNLSRISWERATPEGWEEAIKRMVRLNGLELTPAQARPILKYLATYHGLAPEEAKPVMYMAEHRVLDESIPDDTVRTTCTTCHALGRGTSWRRTKEEWKLLANMHVAFFPQAEVAFRRGPNNSGGNGTGTPPDPSAPPLVDHTIDLLAKNYGLHTPEWAAWRARMRPPKLAGRWLVSAHMWS